MGSTTKPIPVLLGPTASGKTSSVCRLDPERFEAISVDSRQVYCGLEISSAAPSQRERLQMPHHLVSVLSPDEPVDAAWFVKEATKAILAIQERGKIPILVGGAGFYFLALESGGLRHPPALPEVRERLLALDKEGRRKLFETYFPGRLLSPSDPNTNAAYQAGPRPKAAFLQRPIHPNDDYRITRALEVALTEEVLEQRKTSGEIHTATSPPKTENNLNKTLENSHKFHFTGWWLHPPKKEWWEKIRRRVQRMLSEGMVEEVLSVYEQFGECPGLASLGCLEIIQKYAKASGGKNALLALEDRIAILHRQYGKRQRTWFRNKTTLEEILPEEFAAKITQFLEEHYS